MKSIIEQLCSGLKKNDEEEVFEEILYLNKDEEDEMEIHGYEHSSIRSMITWTLIFLTLGSLRLVLHWCPKWLLQCTHRRCRLKYAQRVLVISKYQGSHKTIYVEKVRRLAMENPSLEDRTLLCNDRDEENVSSVIYSNGDARHSVRIHFSDGTFTEQINHIMIKVKEVTYIWRDDKKQFCKLSGLEKGFKKTDFHDMNGYSWQEQKFRRVVYGMNEITIKVDSYFKIIMMELLTPFYIFQVFSVTLWIIEAYLFYTGVIIAMSCFGIILAAVQLRENQEKLLKTVQMQGKVVVRRRALLSTYDFSYDEVSINYLVPGDIIVIPRKGFVCPCDAILLNGNCTVNESMLTGESVPVTKTALPCIQNSYNEKDDVNHTLYCGTEILQARYIPDKDILAVVLRTGFMTAKGNLVRSIMYPIPHDFIFDRDCYKFMGILGILALIGVTYTAYCQIVGGVDSWDTIIDSLDIITIVVPPALPAAMSVGKYYAQNRLQRKKITCMNPSVINVSGSINCVCFDKTGTLTEDSLDLNGVIPSENQQLTSLITDVCNLNNKTLVEAMASCHSLTLLNGIVSGDTLDVKMFEATGWILSETTFTDTNVDESELFAPTVVKSPKDDTGIGIVQQFQFSSSLQRMSVITLHPNVSDFIIYCKGSPEMIASLCTTESVPSNLNKILEKQTEKGYRVIAIAYKCMPRIDVSKLQKIHRNEVECDLMFAGLIVFENKLKVPTTYTISTLIHGGMKIFMLTGDNIQTAICVARECGIINSNDFLSTVEVYYNEDSKPRLVLTSNKVDITKFAYKQTTVSSNNDIELGWRIKSGQRLAMTGSVWEIIRDHFPSYISMVLQYGAVFARMSPDQKQQVIRELQKMGYYVAMCGDGANDCGALKTADVGISLSEAEASVASPFTSRQADISCVPKVIREGRATLVTTVGLFKFMVLYSLLECFSTVVLFGVQQQLSDLEYLYIDGFLVVTTAFFFGQTKPYKGPLVPKAPNSRLLSFIPMMSVLMQVVINFGVQLYSQYLIHLFPWYKPGYIEGNIYQTYDNYAVYAVSQFQYVIIAMTFSVGKPYRQSMFQNVPFFISIVILTVTSFYMTLFPLSYIQNLFQLLLPPFEFRLIICTLAFANFGISIFVETFVLNYLSKMPLRINPKELNFKVDQFKDKSCWNISEECVSFEEATSYGTLKK